MNDQHIINHDRDWIIGCIEHDGFIHTHRFDKANQIILEALSADRPTGEWVRLEREENVYDLHGVPTWGVNYMCDKCGFITTAIQDHFGQYKFCPNCGVKMGGDDK